MTDPEPCVLDASALLAILRGESAAPSLVRRLPTAVMSAVSWAEVLQEAAARRLTTEGLRADLTAAGLRILPFGPEDAAEVAALAETTGGLSFGARACLALGRRLGIPVLTTDRAWAPLGEESAPVVVVG